MQSNVREEESAKLRALYKERSVGISQAEFGKKFMIGSQSMVWQYLNGRLALNIDVARKFADALKVNISDFSPSLASKEFSTGGSNYRIAVNMHINPELKSAMLKIYADRKLKNQSLKQYELYEMAISDFVKKNGY